MKKHLQLLILSAPLASLAACGTNQTLEQALNDQENSLMSQAALSEEPEELVADQIEDLSGALSLEDEGSGGFASSLVLTQNKESSSEKSCSTTSGILTYKKSSSREKEIDKSVRKGRVERFHSRESSFERIYSPAQGNELAMECNSSSGPVRLIKEKLSAVQGTKIEAKFQSKKESSLKLDGAVKVSRSVKTEGLRTIEFTAASESGDLIVLGKTITINSSSEVSKIEKGLPNEEKNSYATIKEAPLIVEVARTAKDGKLIHKLIKSGHVQIVRGEDRKIDIVYEQVKFSAQCKPVSGRLLVSRVDPVDATAVSLSISFKDGEAFVSRNGSGEKKMDSLNLRLEDCRK